MTMHYRRQEKKSLEKSGNGFKTPLPLSSVLFFVSFYSGLILAVPCTVGRKQNCTRRSRVSCKIMCKAADYPCLTNPKQPYLFNGATWRPDLSAFSSSSKISLESPRSPSRALVLIRDHRLHRQLGDFDDHLENVSVDWLNNAQCFDESPTT